MKKLLSMLCTSGVLLFVACHSDQTKEALTAADEQQRTTEANFLKLSLDEYQHLSPAEKEARRSIFKLGQYVLLDSINHCYKLTISKEEAVKQDIPAADYDSFVAEMEKANQTIQEYMKAGKSIQLTDPQKKE